MSYKDLEEARAKREAKDKATTGKGKRGRKRKSPALEADIEASSSVPKDKVVRISEIEPVEAVEVPWRAPVANMY